MTAMGLKFLNNKEMSAQEAAGTRTCIMIAMMRPHERIKAREGKSTMIRKNLPGDTTGRVRLRQPEQLTL